MNGPRAWRSCGEPAGAGRRALTLIELLVVISIIVLLVALLLPVTHKARKQARNVGCQSNLRQLAVIVHQYTSEHDGRFYRYECDSGRDDYLDNMRPLYEQSKRLWECPAKTFDPDHGWLWWKPTYALNRWVKDLEYWGDAPHAEEPYYWRTVDAAGTPSTVPVLLDVLGGPGASPRPTDEPPPCEGVVYQCMSLFCTARHGRTINGAFMDWSVRRIGLKELWTLKWHREYNTAGSWTKAGGALPQDWPKWMRQFRDY